MRKVLLAASLLLAGAAFAPASAQYYYGPGYGPPPGPPPGYGGYGPPPGPPPGYGGYGPPPGYGYRQPRRRASTVCITARGPCPIGEVVPRGWPCGCVVPGFGYKRGNAG